MLQTKILMWFFAYNTLSVPFGIREWQINRVGLYVINFGAFSSELDKIYVLHYFKSGMYQNETYEKVNILFNFQMGLAGAELNCSGDIKAVDIQLSINL